MREREEPPKLEGLNKDAFDKQWDKEKDQRHLDNLQHLTGFYHGTYFENGVGHPREKVIYERDTEQG